MKLKSFFKKSFPNAHKQYLQLRAKIKGNENIFTNIFEGNSWSDEESVSGPGSKYAATKHLLVEIRHLFDKYKIESVLDAPCGDFNWLKNFNFESIDYLGVDIVKDLIISNEEKFKKNNINFIHGDISKIELPKKSLILCRDCLVHLSYETIFKIIKNFKDSGSKYLLTTTFTDVKENKDIINGDWRKINLNIEPFNFPKADLYIDEKCPKNLENGRNYDKNMALWELKNLYNY